MNEAEPKEGALSPTAGEELVLQIVSGSKTGVTETMVARELRSMEISSSRISASSLNSLLQRRVYVISDKGRKRLGGAS